MATWSIPQAQQATIFYIIVFKNICTPPIDRQEEMPHSKLAMFMGHQRSRSQCSKRFHRIRKYAKDKEISLRESLRHHILKEGYATRQEANQHILEEYERIKNMGHLTLKTKKIKRNPKRNPAHHFGKPRDSKKCLDFVRQIRQIFESDQIPQTLDFIYEHREGHTAKGHPLPQYQKLQGDMDNEDEPSSSESSSMPKKQFKDGKSNSQVYGIQDGDVTFEGYDFSHWEVQDWSFPSFDWEENHMESKRESAGFSLVGEMDRASMGNILSFEPDSIFEEE